MIIFDILLKIVYILSITGDNTMQNDRSNPFITWIELTDYEILASDPDRPNVFKLIKSDLLKKPAWFNLTKNGNYTLIGKPICKESTHDGFEFWTKTIFIIKNLKENK